MNLSNDELLPTSSEAKPPGPANVGGEVTKPTVPADILPTRLNGEARVEPIDLTPMTFERIEWQGRRLVLEPPLTLEPMMDDGTGLL